MTITNDIVPIKKSIAKRIRMGLFKIPILSVSSDTKSLLLASLSTNDLIPNSVHPCAPEGPVVKLIKAHLNRMESPDTHNS